MRPSKPTSREHAILRGAAAAVREAGMTAQAILEALESSDVQPQLAWPEAPQLAWHEAPALEDQMHLQSADRSYRTPAHRHRPTPATAARRSPEASHCYADEGVADAQLRRAERCLSRAAKAERQHAETVATLELENAALRKQVESQKIELVALSPLRDVVSRLRERLRVVEQENTAQAR